jgi:hypothetical protein
MYKMAPRNWLQIRQVLLKPGLERFQGHVVQWRRLAHVFLGLMAV